MAAPHSLTLPSYALRPGAWVHYSSGPHAVHRCLVKLRSLLLFSLSLMMMDGSRAISLSPEKRPPAQIGYFHTEMLAGQAATIRDVHNGLQTMADGTELKTLLRRRENEGGGEGGARGRGGDVERGPNINRGRGRGRGTRGRGRGRGGSVPGGAWRGNRAPWKETTLSGRAKRHLGGLLKWLGRAVLFFFVHKVMDAAWSWAVERHLHAPS